MDPCSARAVHGGTFCFGSRTTLQRVRRESKVKLEAKVGTSSSIGKGIVNEAALADANILLIGGSRNSSLRLAFQLIREYQEKNLLSYKEEEEAPPQDSPGPAVEDEKPTPEEQEEPPKPIAEVEALLETTGDLLGLDEINPLAAELEQSNALALAIVSRGDNAKALPSNDLIVASCHQKI